MPFFIDDIKERIEAGAVSVKRNGKGFLITSKNFHPLIPGKELEEEYETITLESFEQVAAQAENEIANFGQNIKNLELQTEQNRAEIEKREALRPHFEYFRDYLTNFDKPKKEKK